MNIRIGTPLRTIIVALAVYLGSYAHAQSLPDNPPDQVIAAAAATFGEYSTGYSLDDFIKSALDSTRPVPPGSNAETPIIVPITINRHPHGSILGGPVYPSQLITSLVRMSNIVCIGEPLKSWTYPTAEKTFGVTIYLVKLTNTVVPDKLNDPSLGCIYIAKPGGRFTYDNKYFFAVDKDFPALTLHDSYLFFATRVGPASYKVTPQQTLKVSGSSVIETSVEHLYAEYFKSRNLDAIMREASDAWNQSDAARKESR